MIVHWPEDTTELENRMMDKLTDFAMKSCTQEEINAMISYLEILEKQEA